MLSSPPWLTQLSSRLTVLQPTQLIKLSQLNTFSRFCQKHNFFGVPKICSFGMWHITWLLPFTLNIPSNQSSVLLGWPFYNSKSSKLNNSASLFEKRNKKLLVTSLELSIPPVKWSELMLDGAFVGTLFLPVKKKLDQTVLINDRGTCNTLLLSHERLFIKLLKKLKGVQPISNNSCAPIIDISYIHLLAPLLQLFFPLKSHLNSS